MKTLLLCLVFIQLIGLSHSHPRFQAELTTLQQQAYQVTLDSVHAYNQFAADWHALLLASYPEKNQHILEVNTAQQQVLLNQGYALKPAKEWLEQYLARQTATLAPQTQPAKKNNALLSTIPGFPCYETVETTLSTLESLASNYTHLATINDIGQSQRQITESNGYPIRVLLVTDSASELPKTDVFIQGAMHAREYVTAPLVLALAKHLLENFGSDPQVTALLQQYRIHLLPQSNPDGRKFAETGLLWRKNGNLAICTENTSRQGVDLNRNFGFKWGTVPNGSSGDECDTTYRGPNPSSESETQAVETYLAELFSDDKGPNDADPVRDDKPGLHIDIHSYGQLILYPWGHSTGERSPNELPHKVLAQKTARINRSIAQQSAALYPTDGTSEASYGELGVAHLTLEVGTEFFQDCATYTDQLLPDNLQALTFMIAHADAPYRRSLGPLLEGLTLEQTDQQITLKGVAQNTVTEASTGNDAYIASISVFASLEDALLERRAVSNANADDAGFDSANEAFSATLQRADLNENNLVYLAATTAAGYTGPIIALDIENPSTNESAPDNTSDAVPDSETPAQAETSSGGGALATLTVLLLFLVGQKLARFKRFA
ncbi:MAG: M14 family zinc carboxypeptidase [Pseudomonadota bacterium]